MSISEEYWKNADIYKLGEHWNYNQKLSYDVQKIIPHVRRYNTIADIGCGEAKVTRILNKIFNFNLIYLYDINESCLFRTLLNTPLNFRGETGNLNEKIPQEIKDSEMILWLGGINYIFNDRKLKEILSSLNNIIIRSCCYKEQTYINKYSKELKSNYEVLYRTKDEIKTILSSVFKSVKYERLYPNYLESKFGGIQYLFVGENKIC